MSYSLSPNHFRILDHGGIVNGHACHRTFKKCEKRAIGKSSKVGKNPNFHTQWRKRLHVAGYDSDTEYRKR